MTERSDTRRNSVLLAGGLVAALSLAAFPAYAERLVIAMDPPVIESNLLWLGGIGEPQPWMQTLVGNNPETGEYDNSGLAESWEANDDLTEWTFRLHPNAEFHFGWGPVTARDVVHSYNLHTGPDATYEGLPLLKADAVEAIDDQTVVFRFNAPRIDYVFDHAGRGRMLVYSLAQYEAEGIDGYHKRPAGTGAFQYVERRLGEGILLERAENPWQGVVTDFDELEFRWVPEASTKLAMLLSGEAHIADLPRELHESATGAGHVVIRSRRPARQTVMNFNGVYRISGDPDYNPDLPWDDVRVRQALNMSIDRETMVDVLYGDTAEVLVRYGMHPGREGFRQELVDRFDEEYGYNPDRARELLAEAGYPDAFPDPVIPIISTVVSGNPEFGTMAELLQVFFEEVGVQTELREMDMAAWAAASVAREAFFLGPIRNAPIRPTQAFMTTFYLPEGTPYGGYKDDTTVRLTRELIAELDPVERDRIAGEFFTYVFDNFTDLPMGAGFATVTVNPKVVADWPFPGVTGIGVSHFELIEAAE